MESHFDEAGYSACIPGGIKLAWEERFVVKSGVHPGIPEEQQRAAAAIVQLLFRRIPCKVLLLDGAL